MLSTKDSVSTPHSQATAIYTGLLLLSCTPSSYIMGSGITDTIHALVCACVTGGQMAERLGSRAINQKVASSIPGHAKLRCVLGQGTSPYLLWGNVPVLYVSCYG